MGLDMYLYVYQYVDKYDYKDGETILRPQFQAITEMLGTEKLLDKRDWSGYHIKVPVGRWRKANAIHGWIVNNCANGVDNCQEIWISPDKAKELVGLCSSVLFDNSKAEDLLPPTLGFFFGSDDIDEFYFESLERTIKLLEPLIESDEVDGIYYQASW